MSDQDQRCRQCDGRFADPLAGAVSDVPATESNLEVTADREQQTALASGNVLFREPGIALTGDTIYYDSTLEQAQVTGAQFVMHSRHMSGAAETLSRTANGQIDIEDGRMSYCSPDDLSLIHI